jgi:putative flippase GtrA
MRSMAAQMVRYAVVGVATNLLLYGCFLLLLLGAGLPYAVAMTVSYAVGIALAFAAQRRWTFAHRGARGKSALRFLACYGLGYLLNLAGLRLLVDSGLLGPAPAQAVMIVIVAACLFVLQKAWVFRAPHGDSEGEAGHAA